MMTKLLALTLSLLSFSLQAYELGRIDLENRKLGHQLAKLNLNSQFGEKSLFLKSGANLIGIKASHSQVRIRSLILYYSDGQDQEIDQLKQFKTNSRLGDQDQFFIKIATHKTLEGVYINTHMGNLGQLDLTFYSIEKAPGFDAEF